MRIISQNGLHNLPYDLITIHRNRDNEIWAYTWQGEGYILGEYSTEEKAEYVFEHILIQTRNRNIYGDSYRLPKDESVKLNDEGSLFKHRMTRMTTEYRKKK